MKGFSLGSVDVKKILTHFAVYVLGYAAMGAVLFVMHSNLGGWNQVIQLGGGLILDSLRKFLDGTVE